MRRLSSTKEFKLPRKVLQECNTVNHISVPRKLRSAMKKRSRESVSPLLPDKKNPSCATEGFRLAGEGKKKLRVNRKDDQAKAPMTKDEEEAAETLIALAEMFPNNNKNGVACESTDAESPLLEPENGESTREPSQVKCSIQQSVSSTTHPVHLMPSCVSTTRCFGSEVSTITRSKLVHEEVAASERRSEIAIAISAPVESLLERQFARENSKVIGLWPGLSSAAASLSTDTKESPTNSLAAYNLTPMSLNASKAQSSLSKNGTSTDEDSRDPVVRNKSWKRCIAHVHIGHLIKGMQTAEKTNINSPQPPNQLTENEKRKQEARVNETLEIGVGSSAGGKDQNETRNAILQHKRLVQDQQRPSPTSTLYATSKQSFNFLSLSTGGSGVEATKTATKTRNLVEPWAPFHTAYPQSIAHNHTNTPFSLPQSHYLTAPFTDYYSATEIKQMQPQLYASKLLDPTQLDTLSTIQNQQRIWASHFASQYKPMELSSPHNIPNMQNRKLDPPTSVPFSQSLELLHPMYIPMFPQQGHNLISLTSSLHHSRAKTPQHDPSLPGTNGIPISPSRCIYSATSKY